MRYARYGNGVVTQHTFNQNNGLVESIVSGKHSGNINQLKGNIQDLEFGFDSLGNVHYRKSQRAGSNENLEEEFSYDGLNRITGSVTTGLSLTPRIKEYEYDVYGRITYKSDIKNNGELKYQRTNGAGFHAVTQADGKTYRYDSYGNMTQRGNQSIAYDVFNKPIKIENTQFFYGPDHARFKQVNGSITTYYVNGGQYEEVRWGSNTVKKSTVGDYYFRTTKNNVVTERYLHRDHLGSVEAISSASGSFINRLSFDVWGKRQQADWGTGDPTHGRWEGYDHITRGYTGHEHLNHLGLIHMNGRVYDPTIGRFLSADPVVKNAH
ncbi:MAG: RHS repeat-associated core domain-containing protein, partial [Verrucomicrobiota bacterium]